MQVQMPPLSPARSRLPFPPGRTLGLLRLRWLCAGTILPSEHPALYSEHTVLQWRTMGQRLCLTHATFLWPTGSGVTPRVTRKTAQTFRGKTSSVFVCASRNPVSYPYCSALSSFVVRARQPLVCQMSQICHRNCGLHSAVNSRQWVFVNLYTVRLRR